jgi:tripartite-type tricarboxylate transporter receptor subunit TctC
VVTCRCSSPPHRIWSRPKRLDVIRGEGWYGIYAPAKTPAEVVAQLNRAVVEAVRTDEFKKRLTPLGVQATGTSAVEFSRIQKSDYEPWGPVVKASGFKPD